MRRIDKLLLTEIMGPWVFGVAIFTVLIMAGTYLFKLTDYVVSGISLFTVIELTVMLLPGIMAKTFPMAVLLASLLAFGRLSGDSEIVALRAAGTSLMRIMVTVGVFGMAVSVLAFVFNESLVPAAAIRGVRLQSEIDQKIHGVSYRPTSYPIYDQGKLRAIVAARDFSMRERTLRGAAIISFDEDGEATGILLADTLRFENERDWEIKGKATITQLPEGRSYASIEQGVWPPQVPRLTFSPDDLIAQRLRELDAYSMRKMAELVENARKNRNFNPAELANLQYGYWNKIAVPLAAFVYALVGAPLGIRNHRTGAAVGFWISVVMIFAYMLIANTMAVAAQGGAIPAWLASFAPIILGLIAAAVIIRARNI